MRVAEILRHKSRILRKIRSIETVGEATAKLAFHDIGALLVYDPWGRYLGIFSERDLIRGLARHGEVVLDRSIEELMNADIVTCQPEDRIGDALRIMTVHRIRYLPVEEQGDVIGIVSIGDLVRGLLDEKMREVEVLRDMVAAH